MATLSVPRKISKSGSLRVMESEAEVQARIARAVRNREAMIRLTEHGTMRKFSLKHSLIDQMQDDPKA